MTREAVHEQRLNRLPFHFMGVDCEFYEQCRDNKNVYYKMSDWEGTILDSITREDAFLLYDWPKGFVFRIITPDHRVDNVIVDEDLNILSGGELLTYDGKGNINELMRIDIAKHGKDNVSYKQLNEIKIYRLL